MIRDVRLIALVIAVLVTVFFISTKIDFNKNQIGEVLDALKRFKATKLQQLAISEKAKPQGNGSAVVHPPAKTPSQPSAPASPLLNKILQQKPAAIANRPPKHLQVTPEPPLPNYGRFYNYNKVPLESSAFAACTLQDVPLVNSDPRPSAGCRNQKHSPGINFMCINPDPVTCGLSRARAREIFFRNIVRITAKCDGRRDVGDERKDGVWRTCMSEPYALKKNACLVYSFGINHEWSFDDTISKVYRCELHAFDPSMNTSDHKRDDKISFYNLGVSGHGMRFQDSVRFKWKMMPINDIVHLLGHQDRIIDILKVDIDFAEWDAFDDLLKTNMLRNVKQLVMEFHAWTDHTYAYVRDYRILTAIENAGFEKWFINNKKHMKFDAINPETGKPRTYHYQIDVSYINTRFL